MLNSLGNTKKTRLLGVNILSNPSNPFRSHGYSVTGVTATHRVTRFRPIHFKKPVPAGGAESNS